MRNKIERGRQTDGEIGRDEEKREGDGERGDERNRYIDR